MSRRSYDGNGLRVQKQVDSATPTTKWQFTSYERDSESGNDYAMERSYLNRLGRFSSSDPVAGSTDDPQSLNRYTYALNNAVNLMDPLGLWSCTVTKTYIQYWLVDPETGERTFLGEVLDSVESVCFFDASDFGLGGGGGNGPGGGMNAARKLLTKSKCAEFLARVAIGAAIIVNNGTLSADELNFVLQNASFNGLTAALDHATFNSTSSTPQTGGFESVAQAFSATQSITLYPPYFNESQTGQGQTLIHEALHLTLGFSDQQLGTAATGRPFGQSEQDRAQASSAFQEQLKKNCK